VEALAVLAVQLKPVMVEMQQRTLLQAHQSLTLAVGAEQMLVRAALMRVGQLAQIFRVLLEQPTLAAVAAVAVFVGTRFRRCRVVAREEVAW
jgi:hypothetical protein